MISTMHTQGFIKEIILIVIGLIFIQIFFNINIYKYIEMSLLWIGM